MPSVVQQKKKEFHFESFAFVEEDQRYWWASWYAQMLGYQSLSSFKNPIKKAQQACQTLGIDVSENFLTSIHKVEGRKIRDYKLSRFACFLIAMNADTRKAEVAKAQVYFATQVEKLNLILSNKEDFERLLIRSEIKASNQELIHAAAKAGVTDFRTFMSEGTIGLYNQPISELKASKYIPANKSIYDFMGKTELAANLFRIALTEEHLEKKHIRNPEKAILIHRKIAASIRRMIKMNTGKLPEELNKNQSLSKYIRSMKTTKNLMNKI